MSGYAEEQLRDSIDIDNVNFLPKPFSVTGAGRGGRARAGREIGLALIRSAAYAEVAMLAARSILIVEDEPLIAMMLEDFLDSLGHTGPRHLRHASNARSRRSRRAGSTSPSSTSI